MARINIEEKWWTDPRREKLAFLLGSFLIADGLALKLWRLSQENWKGSKKDKEKQLIPLSKFEFIEFREKLLEAKMCEIRDEGVYVFGSEEHHEWLLSKKRNGKLGGLKKSEGLKKQKELANPSESYRTLANSSEFYPPTPTLPPTPALKENKNYIAQNSVSSVPVLENNLPKIDFKKRLEEIYQRYPKKLGKSKGMAKLQRTIKTESDLMALESAITRFISFHDKNLTEKQFVPYWSTWANSWKDWLDPEIGTAKDFSQKAEDNYERAFEKIRIAEEQRLQKEKEQNVSG